MLRGPRSSGEFYEHGFRYGIKGNPNGSGNCGVWTILIMRPRATFMAEYIVGPKLGRREVTDGHKKARLVEALSADKGYDAKGVIEA